MSERNAQVVREREEEIQKRLKSRSMMDRDRNKKAVKLIVMEVEAKGRRNQREEKLLMVESWSGKTVKWG